MKITFVTMTSVLFLSLASGLTLGVASAATMHDDFAAATDGAKLPPCPSIFKCSVR